jgi:glc operon protein GlcG
MVYGLMKGTVAVLALTTATLGDGAAVVRTKGTLTLEGARVVMAAALAEAKRVGAPGAGVAIVDAAGDVMCVERLDGTFAAAWRISIGKARTAAMFGKPTSLFEKIIKEGRTPMLALEDFTPLQGGVPIVVDGEVVGAIGVSGASSAQQDEELAIAGASSVTSRRDRSAEQSGAKVIHIGAADVRAAFERNGTLVDAGAEGFMVNASRRDSPGLAEVHTKETDIFHVLTGSATLVTGGAVDGATATADGRELRGRRIEGGEVKHLSAGDVVVVPKNVPHWFSEVHAPMTYYVVKVR